LTKKLQPNTQDEFRARWHELVHVVRLVDEPAISEALRRFHAASIALHLSQQPRPPRGAVGRDRGRFAKLE
jgi:hypothetical protein